MAKLYEWCQAPQNRGVYHGACCNICSNIWDEARTILHHNCGACMMQLLAGGRGGSLSAEDMLYVQQALST